MQEPFGNGVWRDCRLPGHCQLGSRHGQHWTPARSVSSTKVVVTASRSIFWQMEMTIKGVFRPKRGCSKGEPSSVLPKEKSIRFNYNPVVSKCHWKVRPVVINMISFSGLGLGQLITFVVLAGGSLGCSCFLPLLRLIFILSIINCIVLLVHTLIKKFMKTCRWWVWCGVVRSLKRTKRSDLINGIVKVINKTLERNLW